MTFARSLALLTYIIPRPIEVGGSGSRLGRLFISPPSPPPYRWHCSRERRNCAAWGLEGGGEKEREKTAILRYPRLLHPLPLPRYLLDSRVAQKQPPEWKPSDKHCLSEDDLFGCPNFKSYIFGGLLSGVSCHRLARSLSLGSFYEDGLRPPRARTA